MAVAFEEVRNLALGVAARGVQWPALGPAAGLRVRQRPPPRPPLLSLSLSALGVLLLLHSTLLNPAL